MNNIFSNYPWSPRHYWFGEGGVQDLSDIYGFFRAFMSYKKPGQKFYEEFATEKDFSTFGEAATELVVMHERYFKGIVWC